MPRLFFVFYSMIASMLAAVAVVVSLLSGVTGAVPLIGSAALGAAIAVPVTWVVARRIDDR